MVVFFVGTTYSFLVSTPITRFILFSFRLSLDDLVLRSLSNAGCDLIAI
jgi:hypothetical protein